VKSTRSADTQGMLERVLIVEPPGQNLASLAEAFARVLPADARIERLETRAAFTRLDADEPGELLLVLHEAEPEALAHLARLRSRLPDAALVLAVEPNGGPLGQRAVEAGASDLLVLGPRLEERVGALVAKLVRLAALLRRTRRLDEQNARLHQSLHERSRIFGESPQLLRLLEQIERVARIPRPLLITGERGTGKELVARAIHFASGRGAGTMVTINCAALGDSLLESELFGHERGAFTGAERAHPGKFEQADGGTLFLDEIGNMPLPFQRKILRVVEYGTFTRVGGGRERKTSARILAATNVDLRAKIERSEFLGDLYDRLAFEVIEVPPLRERPGDVEILARAFLDQFADEIPAFRGKRLADSALAILRAYPFPGNVRELKNIIERAAYRDTTNEITPEDIGLLPRAQPAPDGGSFSEQVATFSRQLLERALAASAGNQAEAARRLGLSYDQLRHYRRKYLGG
jgi:transcriptional regulator with GAF, ATPase, and Fis domain